MIVVRPRCLVTDLDRTLTGPDLALDPRTLRRVDALRDAGLLVVVATGRRWDPLVALGIPSRVDAIVAENGALVAVGGEPWVADPGFVARARAALGGLAGAFAWGRAIASGPRGLAEEAGARLALAGVAHAVEFNADEVMLLPAGVDKATGAARALEAWGLSWEDAWAIGDGENDVALLRSARVGGAPRNATRAAAEAADVRLASAYGDAFLDFTAALALAR